ncbi:MAG: Ig-like domain-containing protein [Spirochaetota bacterium]
MTLASAIRTAAVTAGVTVLLSCCTQATGIREILAADPNPPVVTGVATQSNNTITVICSESVTGEAEDFSVLEYAAISSLSIQEERLLLTAAKELHPGTSYTLTGTIKDMAGNQTYFETQVYGWNPSPPEIIINEFTARGSQTHPDTIELLVLSDGNTAGITCYDGVRSGYRQACVLPPVEVTAGDYLVIHCHEERSEEVPLPPEQQFRMQEAIGLSGNNGVLSLYGSPQGNILDAVVYSNRFATSDTDYGGFASSHTWEAVQVLWDQTEWRAPVYMEKSSGPIPEHAIRSENTSATRSVCRSYPPEDTDTAEDWHIVPTSNSSFGSQNTNAVYGE